MALYGISELNNTMTINEIQPTCSQESVTWNGLSITHLTNCEDLCPSITKTDLAAGGKIKGKIKIEKKGNNEKPTASGSIKVEKENKEKTAKGEVEIKVNSNGEVSATAGVEGEF